MRKIIIGVVVLSMVLMAGSVLAYTPGDFEGYDFGGETVYTDADYDEDAVREAEEKFNVEIVIGDIDIRERVLAGEATHDIYRIVAEDFWSDVGQGYYLPISDVVPGYYEELGEAAQGVLDAFTYRDEIYGIWWGTFIGVNNTMRFTLWNKDLFDELGLPDLNELYEQGEFTWENVRDIGLEATADTTGDGEIDRWGIYSLYPYMDLMVSNEARYITLTEDGAQYTANSPEAIEAWETGYQWLAEDEILTIQWDDHPWKEGNAAIFPTDLWRYGFYHDVDFDWGILPLPKGPNAEEHHVAQNVLGSAALPITAEDPEALLALHDFLVDRPTSLEEYEARFETAIQGAINDWAPDRFSAEILERYKKNWDGHMVRMSTAIMGDLFWDTRSDILNGEVTATEGFNAIEAQVNGIIEDIFRF